MIIISNKRLLYVGFLYSLTIMKKEKTNKMTIDIYSLLIKDNRITYINFINNKAIS